MSRSESCGRGRSGAAATGVACGSPGAAGGGAGAAGGGPGAAGGGRRRRRPGRAGEPCAARGEHTSNFGHIGRIVEHFRQQVLILF